jgi:hypothetical protein
MPYVYAWTKDGNSYANTENLSNLSGDYKVTITEANSCDTFGNIYYY